MSTRSYILGLGSGLILSAMLTLVISPHSQSSTPTSPNSSQSTAQPAAQPTNKATIPSNPTNPSPSGSQNLSSASSPSSSPSSSPPSSSQAERSFVIPNGASAERIADLLVAQGFITDKASFLESVHKKGVESQFRAGTFNLTAGLTPDEVIQRLLKK